MRRLLREQRFDIVHANEAHALTAAWLARATSAGAAGDGAARNLSLSRSALRWRATARRRASSPCRRPFANNLLAGGTRPRAHRGGAGRRGNSGTLSSEERAAARARWDFAPASASWLRGLAHRGKRACVASGSVRRTADAGQSGARFRLLLAGDGPLRAALEQQAARRAWQMVMFAGFVGGCAQRLCGVRCVRFSVAARRRRHVLANAMAHALPVIATARAALRRSSKMGETACWLAANQRFRRSCARYAAELYADRWPP